MMLNFSTRDKARQFAAKRKAGGYPAKLIDNATKVHCVASGTYVTPYKRFAVCLKGN